MRLILALISLGLCGAAAAQDYRQWDGDPFRLNVYHLARQGDCYFVKKVSYNN